MISEGSYGYGEPKNVICISVQKPYRTVRACKSPRFEMRRIVPFMDFWGKSVVPIALVPCLHKENIDIKRKLQVWGAQKFNLYFGAKTVPNSTGVQITYVRTAPYSAVNGFLG